MSTYRTLYDHMREQGLSPGTIRSLPAVLSQALNHASKSGSVARGLAKLVMLPKQERREVKAMSALEVKRFLMAAREDRYHALWTVLLSGGLRPSEALGLGLGSV